MGSSMGGTDAVESVSSTPMPGLCSSCTSVRGIGFKADGLCLRGLGVDTVQCDHETEAVADLTGVNAGLLPAVLLTSEE